MTTAVRRSYFRRNVGDPGDGTNSAVDVFSNDEVDTLYTEADADYSSYSESVIRIATVLLGYETLMADAIKQVTYLQNDSRIDASDLSRNMRLWVAEWRKKLDMAIREDGSSSIVRTGVTKRVPARSKEFPDA